MRVIVYEHSRHRTWRSPLNFYIYVSSSSPLLPSLSSDTFGQLVRLRSITLPCLLIFLVSHCPFSFLLPFGGVAFHAIASSPIFVDCLVALFVVVSPFTSKHTAAGNVRSKRYSIFFCRIVVLTCVVVPFLPCRIILFCSFLLVVPLLFG